MGRRGIEKDIRGSLAKEGLSSISARDILETIRTHRGDIRRRKACSMSLCHQCTLAKTHEATSFGAKLNQHKSRREFL